MNQLQDAFISYGRADSKAFAKKLNDRLVEQGLEVWFDFDDIPLGVDYQNQIDDGIEKADNFIFVIAPHSINSAYCRLEVELALKRNKRIIPLLHIEHIDRETWQQRFPKGTDAEWEAYTTAGKHSSFSNMHPEIGKINWVYFREGIDDFDRAFEGLTSILKRHHDHVYQHTRLLAQALEWERNQKQSRYLLVGQEREQAEQWLKVRFKEEQPPCIPTDLHCEYITESIKNGQNLMTDVLLSYSEQDSLMMEKVRNSLRREGFTVWTNKTDIQTGVAFQAAIEQGIEQADSIVYLMSPDAISSAYCQQEVNFALSLNKRIIPVLIKAIDTEQLQPGLRALQYIDLSDNHVELDYQQDESQLIRILRQEAAYYQAHKILLTKALKWKRQNANPTILLRGYNLHHAEAWLKIAKQHPTHPGLPLQEAFIGESRRQPPNIATDVFVSYSRSDSGFARKLNDVLQAQGKRTWFDQESIAAGTADFQQEIYRGIESADTFLFVLSPRSITSPYCADEVEYAAGLNKRVVTLLHQPIDPAALHPELAKVQWIDFNQHEGDFSANFATLLRVLDTDVEHLQAHTRLLVRAIEWDTKARRESLLLRGDELTIAEEWLSQSADKDPKPTELQQAYISSSRAIEDANRKASQILEAAAAKGKRLALIGMSVAVTGLGVAGFAGFAAYQAGLEIKKAETKTNIADLKSLTAKASEKFYLENMLGALLSGLDAGQTLRSKFTAGSPEWSRLAPRVTGILQQAIGSIREKNALKGHRGRIYQIQSSRDGKMIASASEDRTIKLWDAATGKELRTLTGHTDTVHSVSFSPDDKTIASGSWDNTIKLWDTATGKELRTLKSEAGIDSVSFSPDGKTIVSGGEDKTVKLWNVATGKVLRSLKRHKDTVNAVRFSPDGKMIASGSSDNTIKLWNAATGEELRTFKGHEAAINTLNFSPNGKTIASGSTDKAIRLWNVASGEGLRTFKGHQGSVYSIRFSPDGKTIASGSEDKTIKLWNLEKDVSTTLKGAQGEVNAVSFSPDGKTIASGGDDKILHLWDVDLDRSSSILEEGVNTVSFSPDGKTIVAGRIDGKVKVQNIATGKELRSLGGHKDIVDAVRFSPDGKTIASASQDNTIKLWDATTGKELRSLKGYGTVESDTLSFSPDGRTIASVGEDNTIKLWDTTTGKELRTLKGHKKFVYTLSFSPDRRTIASAGEDKLIKVWDVQTGKELRTLKGHQNPIYTLSFSPDGKTLASGSSANVIRLWDLATGNQLKSVEDHQGAVNNLMFSPDGQMLISGSTDNTIRIWSADLSESLATLEADQGGVNSLSFSPDGKTFVSAGADGTVKLWSLDLDLLMTKGCNWLKPYLINNPGERDLCKGYLGS